MKEMDKSGKNNSSSGCGSGSCDVNFCVIKGIAAIVIGGMFILMAHKVIVNLILFVAGSALVYYGLIKLNVDKVNKGLTMLTEKIKKFWES